MFASFQVSQHQSTFRVNSQVFQMIGILLVVLAVPLTLVTLGIRQFTSKPKDSTPETQGLRTALEQAAEKVWQAPGAVSDGRSVFVLPASGNSPSARKVVEMAVRKLQGVVLPTATGEGGAERLLIQIPGAYARDFESEALRGFAETQRGKPGGENRLYELIFPAP